MILLAKAAQVGGSVNARQAREKFVKLLHFKVTELVGKK